MKIREIKPSQRVAGRYLVYLDNNDIIRVGEGEILSLGLFVGMEVTEEQAEEMKRQGEAGKLKQQAMNMLSHRSMSKGELAQKLTKKAPEQAQAVEQISDRLEELGLLNDGEYAAAVVRHYSKKGFGKKRVEAELYRRRVPREFWDEAMEEAAPPEESIDAFLCKKLANAPADDPKQLQRVSNALARRGYSWDEISEGISRWQENNKEEF